MKAVLIGSAAIRDDYADIDLIVDAEYLTHFPEAYQSNSPRHYILERPGQSPLIEMYHPSPNTAFHLVLSQSFPSTTINGLEVEQASLPILAALKKAHLIVPNRKWEQHMQDYGKIKELLNIKTFKPSEYGSFIQTVYKTHRQEIMQTTKTHPKLNVNKNIFFEEAEFKVFDHDTIHQAVALGEEPAYTLMQDGEVWCSLKKWRKLSSTEKLRCLIEEASVLALERSIIPFLFLRKEFRGADWAYQKALSKICTTITSGWFRDYSIEHYHQAIRNQPDFIQKFTNGLKNKTIKILKSGAIFRGSGG